MKIYSFFPSLLPAPILVFNCCRTQEWETCSLKGILWLFFRCYQNGFLRCCAVVLYDSAMYRLQRIDSWAQCRCDSCRLYACFFLGLRERHVEEKNESLLSLATNSRMGWWQTEKKKYFRTRCTFLIDMYTIQQSYFSSNCSCSRFHYWYGRLVLKVKTKPSHRWITFGALSKSFNQWVHTLCSAAQAKHRSHVSESIWSRKKKKMKHHWRNNCNMHKRVQLRHWEEAKEKLQAILKTVHFC